MQQSQERRALLDQAQLGRLVAQTSHDVGRSVQEGFDKALIAQGHQFADNLATSVGKSLMDKSDCNSCHKLDSKSIGPNYLDISKKYKTDPKAPQYLSNKIKNGGGGVWGEVMMTPHPNLSHEDAVAMVKYILLLKQQ